MQYVPAVVPLLLTSARSAAAEARRLKAAAVTATAAMQHSSLSSAYTQ